MEESSIGGNKKSHESGRKLNPGLLVAGGVGAIGLLITAFATPFVLPALRKHCLPYVPATDKQLTNISKAMKKHAIKGSRFLDIGSGDGRICRLACDHKIFSAIHGVELNYLLVIFSRLMAIKLGHYGYTKYYHKDLWRFPLANYDTICIFGVESMMKPLESYLRDTNKRQQTIIACRFPFSNITQIDEIGDGIDTVWVYKLGENKKDLSLK